MSKKNPMSGKQKRQAKMKEREKYWDKAIKERARKAREEKARKAKEEKEAKAKEDEG